MAGVTESPLPSPTRPNWIWFLSDVVVSMLLSVWLHYRVRGRQHLPADSGALLLINHQSFLDPMLVASGLGRPISYLARDSLFRIPFLGWFLRKTYVIPISRSATTTGPIKEAVRRLQHGLLVGIFPEGTRSRDGAVGPMKPGFIALIRRGDVPVIPVGIAGAYTALPRDGWFLRRTKVRVVIGEPFSTEDIQCYNERGETDALVALARERIIACQQDAEQWRLQ